MTASMGLPDLGILAMEELCAVVRSIARATDLPLVVDGDTGYGEALNVMRLVRELECAGAAAVHIEDQVLPKKRRKPLGPPAPHCDYYFATGPSGQTVRPYSSLRI